MITAPPALGPSVHSVVLSLLPWLDSTSLVTESPVLSEFWATHSAFHGFLSISLSSFSETTTGAPAFPRSSLGKDLMPAGHYYVSKAGVHCWTADLRAWSLAIAFPEGDLGGLSIIPGRRFHYSLV